jgi:hypothetical protein
MERHNVNNHLIQSETDLYTKSTIFWDIEPCSPLSVSRRFGGTYRLQVCSPPAITPVSCSAYFFDPENGGYMFLRNVGWHSRDYTALYRRRWYSSRRHKLRNYKLGVHFYNPFFLVGYFTTLSRWYSVKWQDDW